MLRVDYTRKLGEAIMMNSSQKLQAYPMYWSNGLYAICYEYTENGEEMVQLISFAADEEHLKNMLGLTKEYAESSMDWLWEVKLDFEYKDAGKIAKILTTAMIKGKWHGTISCLQKEAE